MFACAFWGATLTHAQAPPQTPPPPAGQAPQETPPVAPLPASPLRVIVIDPAHGGTDSGARGSSGVVEKDAVLALAKSLRTELGKQGFEVVLTREGNENPPFDDRAALGNGQRGAVFISLHVASTGRVGSVRAYYQAAPEGKTLDRTLVRWEEAQVPFAERSRRLAELVQVQLGQKFQGSPEVPVAAPVRQLRSITSPAIAVEISSVAAPNGGAIQAMSAELAAALARALTAFRPLYGTGGD